MGKKKKIINEAEIAKELKLSYNTLANFKSRNSKTILMYVVVWCVNNELDIRNFIKKKHIDEQRTTNSQRPNRN